MTYHVMLPSGGYPAELQWGHPLLRMEIAGLGALS